MRKTIAIAVTAILLLAMMPVTALADDALSISSTVIATNYGSGGYAYNPSPSSNGSIEISGPYEMIAVSAPLGNGYGAHYKVVFSIDKGAIDLANDSVRLNGSLLSNIGHNGGKAEIFSNQIVCTFTANPGGSWERFNIEVYDKTADKTVSQSVTVSYSNTSGSSGSWVSPDTGTTATMNAYARTPAYTVQMANGVIYIDYDSRVIQPGSLLSNVSFTFYDSNGYRLPRNGSASLRSVTPNTSDTFLQTSSYTGSFSSELLASIHFRPSVSRVSFEINADGRVYKTENFHVVWRNSLNSAGSIGTGGLSITPSRAPTIGVGQEYTFSIYSNNVVNTGNYFTLEVVGNPGIVTTATGKYLTIRGQSVGQTWLQVKNSAGVVLDSISVNVNYATVVPPIAVLPPTGSGYGTYSVTAQSLNVRSGPGTGFPSIGNLRYGMQVTVNSMANGWANIVWSSGSAYVSQAFLASVGGTVVPPIAVIPPTGSGTSDGGLTGGLGGGSSSSSSPYASMRVTSSWTSVMEGPGSGYATLGQANYGDYLYVYNITDGWALVQWNGRIGFVRSYNLM